MPGVSASGGGDTYVSAAALQPRHPFNGFQRHLPQPYAPAARVPHSFVFGTHVPPAGQSVAASAAGAGAGFGEGAGAGFGFAAGFLRFGAGATAAAAAAGGASLAVRLRDVLT